MLDTSRGQEREPAERHYTENPHFGCVPKIASELITTKENEKEILIGGKNYRAALSSVNTYAPRSFFPNVRKLKNSHDHGGQNRTLLVIEDPLLRGTDAVRAIFDAATGELFGPPGETTHSDADKFADAMAGSLDPESEALSGNDLLLHADRERFINQWIPAYFRELRTRGISGSFIDVFDDEIDRLFPLPEKFPPFEIIAVPSDPRYSVKVEKTSDIIQGLAKAWHHDKNADVQAAFNTLKSISPKLEIAIKIAYQSVFTHRQTTRTLQ